ncbi:MAG TPA: hypothetical protein PKE55_13620 [Kiritimatiellia bacterium]|nr:hypothetical protein [Kiritimatiellia bacterium]
MPEDILFLCPQCGQSLEAPADMAGLFIECPQCGKVIGIPNAHGEAPVATASHHAEEDAPAEEEEKGSTVRIKLPPNLGVPDKPRTRQIFIKRKGS